MYDALCILLSEYELLWQNLQSRQFRVAHHLTACFPAGCVLVPGETLPLRIGPPLAAHSSLRSAAIEQALAAPPPLSRLIAVVRLEETNPPMLACPGVQDRACESSLVCRLIPASVSWCQGYVHAREYLCACK